MYSNICDLICEKRLLLKDLQKTDLYTYSCYICTTIHGNYAYNTDFEVF